MISKLIQTEKYPVGDCFRTVLACLLNKASPEEVPNFMSNGCGSFRDNFEEWLEEEKLQYVEIEQTSLFSYAEFVPNGYCVLVGKSPRGDYNHAVVGSIKTTRKENEIHTNLFFEHDVSPDGGFIDGKILYIGFLSKTI